MKVFLLVDLLPTALAGKVLQSIVSVFPFVSTFVF